MATLTRAREMEKTFRVFEEAIDLWKAMADQWRDIARRSVRERGIFTAALSGGRTPLGFYCFLGRKSGIPWERTGLFQVDERFVSAQDEDSNFHMIDLSLLLRIGTPPGSVNPMLPALTPESTPEGTAAGYEKVLKEFFPSAPLPSFDAVLLGLGEDGHTASLFPGSEAVKEKERWVVAVKPGHASHDRITLTLPVINNARHVFFMVTGRGKADILRRVLEGEDPSVPSSLVNPGRGDLFFYLDREAGLDL